MIMPRSTIQSEVAPLMYRVDEAAAALRLSRSSVYELIRSGQLRTVKQGRRRLVKHGSGALPAPRSDTTVDVGVLSQSLRSLST